MTEIPIEELLKKTGSIFKLVILASKRAIDLSEGKPAHIADVKDKKLSDIALEEIAEGKISFRIEE